MEKQLAWLGGSKKIIRKFPTEARKEAGYQIYRVQQGLVPTDFKPMPSMGLGVFEIRLHRPHEHRVIYVSKFQEAVYILHAFEKKTQKTAEREIKVAKQSYKEMLLRRKNL